MSEGMTREDWSQAYFWGKWGERPTDESYQSDLIEKMYDALLKYDAVEQTLEMLYYERAVQKEQVDYWLD